MWADRSRARTDHRPERRTTVRRLIKHAVVATSAAVVAFLAWAILWPVHGGNFYTGVHIPDPEIGWVLRPSLPGARGHGSAPRAMPRDVVFSDDRGARVSEPSVRHHAPVGLLSIGGSQTFGAGVLVSETFTAVAGRLAALTSANYGVSGYGGVSSLLLLRRHLDDRPRYIVYGFWFDHLNRNLSPCLENPNPFCVSRPAVSLTDGAPRIVLPQGPALWFPARWPVVDRVLIHLAVLRGTFRKSFSPTEQRIAAEYVIREMQNTALKIGAHLLVVWIPSYFDRDIPPVPSWLPEFSRAAGVTLIDGAPALRRLRAGGQALAIADGPFAGHLTVAAHREIGSEIASAIRMHQ